MSLGRGIVIAGIVVAVFYLRRPTARTSLLKEDGIVAESLMQRHAWQSILWLWTTAQPHRPVVVAVATA
jgi:hypothetical protein